MEPVDVESFEVHIDAQVVQAVENGSQEAEDHDQEEPVLSAPVGRSTTGQAQDTEKLKLMNPTQKLFLIFWGSIFSSSRIRTWCILKVSAITTSVLNMTSPNIFTLDITTKVIDRLSFLVVVVAQAVAHRTTDPEVPGLNPAGRWAFLLFSFLSFSQWCTQNQVPHGGATLLAFNFPINSYPCHLAAN